MFNLVLNPRVRPMSQNQFFRRPDVILITVGAIIALIFSIYNYVTPLTGVTATLGALLVCIASIALIVDGAILLYVRTRAARLIWLVLGFLGAVCTFAAGYFLHMPSLMILMVIVFIGLVWNAGFRPTRA